MVNKYNSIQEYLDKIKEERKREKESILLKIECDNLEGHKIYLSRLKKRRIENRIESILNEFGSEIKRNILFSINEQNNIKNIQLKQKDELISLINNKISYYNNETDEFNKKYEEVKNTINKLISNKLEVTDNLLFSFKEYKEKRDKNKNNCKLISSFKIFLEGYFNTVIKLINENITLFNNEFFIDGGNINFLKLWFIFDNDKKFAEIFLRNIQEFNKREIEEKEDKINKQKKTVKLANYIINKDNEKENRSGRKRKKAYKITEEVIVLFARQCETNRKGKLSDIYEEIAKNNNYKFTPSAVKKWLEDHAGNHPLTYGKRPSQIQTIITVDIAQEWWEKYIEG